MKRYLIAVGANGTLGKGVTEYMLTKNYDRFYLVDRKDITLGNSRNDVLEIKVNDLTDESEVEKLFGQIDVDEQGQYFLFSSIGGFFSSPVSETDYEKWKFMFSLNTNVSFLLAKHFSKLVAKCKSGSICFTSALTAKQAEANKSAYGASKAALEYMVKTLAAEGRKIGLSANALAPYILDSPENREWVKDLSLLTNPQDVGNLISDLFNNYKFVSGNIIELKGKLS